MLFRRVAVIGVGLIGGSFAMGLKQANACAHVIGVGRDPANMETALRRGAVDSVDADAGRAAQDADLIMIAAPVAQFAQIFSAIAPSLKDGAVVTDGGSTKRDVIAAARGALKERIGQFVPAHPIAGAEKSGAGAAGPDLFRGKRVVVTPLPENDEQSIERVKRAWALCGARITDMAPAEHDSVLAAVSHLPHLLAFALVHDMAGRPNSGQLFSLAAGGFRDFTRIASSHPEMWRDICVANADALAAEVARFSAKLDHIGKLLANGDGDALQALFAQARDARDSWLSSSTPDGSPGS